MSESKSAKEDVIEKINYVLRQHLDSHTIDVLMNDHRIRAKVKEIAVQAIFEATSQRRIYEPALTTMEYYAYVAIKSKKEFKSVCKVENADPDEIMKSLKEKLDNV